MHTVKCTNCERTLTIPKPVIKGKIRCPACGQVFVGTTHPAGAAGPSSDAAAGRPSAPDALIAAVSGAERPDSPDAAEAPVVKKSIPRPPVVKSPTAAVPRVPAASPRPAAPAASPAPVAPRPERPESPPPAEQSLEEVVAAEEEARSSGAYAPRASVPAGAAYRPMPMAPRKSSKAVLLYLMMGALFILMVIVVVVVANYGGKIWIERHDERGNLISRERVTPEEAARIRAQDEAVAPVRITQDPNTAPARARVTGSDRPEVSPLPKMTGGPTATPPAGAGEADSNAAPAAAPAIALVPEDPKILATSFDKHLLPASTDTGFITGVVTNKYNTALEELRLTPQILDSTGKAVATLSEVVCQYVPADKAARYSCDFAGVPEDQIKNVRVSAQAKPLKGDVCYDADDTGLAVTNADDDKSVVVTGNVHNGGLKAIENCYVYCEFYTRDWKFVKSVKTASSDVLDATDGRLAVGRKSRFKAELTLDEPDPTKSICHAVARLVGKEE
jgi:hypothetical protein